MGFLLTFFAPLSVPSFPFRSLPRPICPRETSRPLNCLHLPPRIVDTRILALFYPLRRTTQFHHSFKLFPSARREDQTLPNFLFNPPQHFAQSPFSRSCKNSFLTFHPPSQLICLSFCLTPFLQVQRRLRPLRCPTKTDLAFFLPQKRVYRPFSL